VVVESGSSIFFERHAHAAAGISLHPDIGGRGRVGADQVVASTGTFPVFRRRRSTRGLRDPSIDRASAAPSRTRGWAIATWRFPSPLFAPRKNAGFGKCEERDGNVPSGFKIAVFVDDRQFVFCQCQGLVEGYFVAFEVNEDVISGLFLIFAALRCEHVFHAVNGDFLAGTGAVGDKPSHAIDPAFFDVTVTFNVAAGKKRQIKVGINGH